MTAKRYEVVTVHERSQLHVRGREYGDVFETQHVAEWSVVQSNASWQAQGLPFRAYVSVLP